MTLLEVIWCYILTSTHMIKNHVFFFLQDQLPIKVMFRLNKTIFGIQDVRDKRETRNKETIVKGIRDEQRGRMRRWAHQGHIYHHCILEYVQGILDETPKSSEIMEKIGWFSLKHRKHRAYNSFLQILMLSPKGMRISQFISVFWIA